MTEIGHSIIYSEIGVPQPDTEAGEYFGFHESAADLVALVSLLHFDSVVDQLLVQTSGNLYSLNWLNRISEYSETTQVRVASNLTKLSDFAHGWSDEHDLAQPLTGAVFDILIDIFHRGLFERGLIEADLAEYTDDVLGNPEVEEEVQARFDIAYAGYHDGFKAALLDARDCVGLFLTHAWQRLTAW